MYNQHINPAHTLPFACPEALPCTVILFGWGLGAGSTFGTVTVSTPLSRAAAMPSSLMLSGRVNDRVKELKWRSRRTTCRD